jgi:hypothetical protein
LRDNAKGKTGKTVGRAVTAASKKELLPPLPLLQSPGSPGHGNPPPPCGLPFLSFRVEPGGRHGQKPGKGAKGLPEPDSQSAVIRSFQTRNPGTETILKGLGALKKGQNPASRRRMLRIQKSVETAKNRAGMKQASIVEEPSTLQMKEVLASGLIQRPVPHEIRKGFSRRTEAKETRIDQGNQKP